MPKRPAQPEPLKCPYNSRMLNSPEVIPDSQATFEEGGSCGPCPMSMPKPAKSGAEHRQDVAMAAAQVYSKRAKYNKDFDVNTKTGIDIAAEKVLIEEAQKAIEKKIQALTKRKEEFEKAVGEHKQREQEAQALLKEIDDDMLKMNEQITNAFLD